jgi:hypothetical protein
LIVAGVGGTFITWGLIKRADDQRLAAQAEAQAKADAEAASRAEKAKADAEAAEREKARHEAQAKADAEAAKVKREAMRSNPTRVVAKDLMNFPEKYIGLCCLVDDIWLHGDLHRDKDFKVFGLGVSTPDGKYVSGVVFGSGLHFVVSEGFGSSLDILLSADKKVHARLYCEIVEESVRYKKNYKLARVYKIETFNRGGGIYSVFEEGKDPVFSDRE